VRGEPIVARVLEATIEELALSGYAGLTLERVATRAGVNRTTIFRRWPTRAELVRAAIQRATGALSFDWDTGSLRGDLRVLIERAGETMLGPGMLGFLQVMLGAREDPELLGLAAEAESAKLAAVLAFFVRAELRGELRPDLDKPLFLDDLMGLLIVKLVFHRQPVTPEFVERLLDHVIGMVSPPRPAPAAAVTPAEARARARKQPMRRR
jgi:AcrR family transcriptional regulator